MESRFIELALFCPLTIQPEKVIIFWKKLDETILKQIQALFTSKQVYIVGDKVSNINLLPNIKFIDSPNDMPSDKHMDLVITNNFSDVSDSIKSLQSISKIMETFTPDVVICDSNVNLNKAIFDEYNGKSSKIFKSESVYKPTKELWNNYYFYDRSFPNMIIIKKKNL